MTISLFMAGGVIGGKTLRVLKELGLDGKIKYFTKSEKSFAAYELEGITVKSVYELQEYYKNAVFLLAVSDKYMKEVMRVVRELRIKNYMDAKCLYLDSYKKSRLALKLRAVRNLIYEQMERGNRCRGSEKIYAAHITYCLAQNAGDTVLSQCVRRFLNFRQYNIKSVTQKVDEALINEINASDVLVIGGGGVFLPDTNENAISGWEWAASNAQIESITKPVILFSVGYNYFRNQENTDLFISSLNCIVRKADFVGLRNLGSVKVVKSLVDDDLKDKIEYQPCTTTLIRKIYKITPVKNTRTVAFNMAFDREERRYGDRQEEILTQAARAVGEIQKKGYSIIYAAHCDDDLRFLPYLDREKVRYRVKNMAQSLPCEVFGFYRKIEVVIGMRGHAQMIPFGIGVKIISLGTHDKMKWFLQDINMEDCYVDLNKETDTIADRIVDIFTDIAIEHPAETDARLAKEQDRLWELSCRNRERIMKIIQEALP